MRMRYGSELSIRCIKQGLQRGIRELGEAVLCGFVQCDLFDLLGARLPKQPLQEDIPNPFGWVEASLVLVLAQDSKTIVNDGDASLLHGLKPHDAFGHAVRRNIGMLTIGD